MPNRQSKVEIQKVCAPCASFVRQDVSCVIVTHGRERLREIFGKPCEPDQFIRKSVRSYLAKRKPAHLAHAEDIAADCALILIRRDDLEIPKRDDGLGLGELQSWLFRFTVHRIIDHFRAKEGRFSCGQCSHYDSRNSCCAHGDSEHPHAGKSLETKQHPGHLEPPCKTFAWHSSQVSLTAFEPDRIETTWASGDPLHGALEAALKQERTRLLVKALAEVQRSNPDEYLVIQMIYMEHRTLEAIAAELDVSVRTISRRKVRGEQIVRKALKKMGVRQLSELLP